MTEHEHRLVRAVRILLNWARKHKICYNITTRGEKKYWNRIGVAFENSDGSINVKLDALPVSGELQIHDYVPHEEPT